jgi:predicted nucleic-acid-binding protein
VAKRWPAVEDRKRVVIDTNLLVRYLTDDDAAKAKAVDHLLKKAGKGEIRILIPSIVIAELVWVLESFYKMEPDGIADLVEALLNTTGVEVTDKSIINESLKLYKAKKIDMIDAWIIHFAKEVGVETIYTFDKKHFKDAEGIETRSP